jgi:hypothetical protein
MYLVDENKINSFTTQAQTNTIRLGALEGSYSVNFQRNKAFVGLSVCRIIGRTPIFPM